MTIKKLIPLDLGDNVVRNFNHQVKTDKERLSILNTHFHEYLEKVKNLQNFNTKLLNEIRNVKQKLQSNEIKTRLDKCLEQKRIELNQECEKFSVLNLQVKNNKLKIQSYREKIDNLEDEKLKNDQKVNSLVYLNENRLHEKSELIEKIKNTKELIEKYKQENDSRASHLQQLNKAFDDKCLGRLENEFKIQSLLEEIQFMKEIHRVLKKEMLGLSSEKIVHESKNNLGLLVKQLREDLETTKKLNVKKLENFYCKKVEDVSFKLKEEVESENEKVELEQEIEALNDLLKSNIFELGDEIRINKIFETKLDDLDTMLSSERENLNKKITEQDGVINDLKLSVKELKESFDLKKIHLATEIQIYKRLLEKVYSVPDNSGDVEIPIIRECAENRSKPKIEYDFNNFENFLRSKFHEKHGQKCSFKLEYLDQEESSSDESDKDSLEQLYEEIFVNNKHK